MEIANIWHQAAKEPVSLKNSPLCYRINKEKSQYTLEAFLPGLIKELQNSEMYDFLRENKEYQKILQE